MSHKKIRVVLVEEGDISSNKLRYGFCPQQILVNSVLAALLSLGMGTTAMAETVSLQWDPNTDANLAGYKVYYSAEPSPLESAVPIDVSTQTVATIAGLDSGQSYKFAVTAYDTAGTESSFSNIVTLAEQVPPTVGITSPLNSATVSGVVTVSAGAADNVGVTKVEFYANGVLNATDTASPYTYSWDTTTVASGANTLMVKAYDAAGNASQSSSTVNVVNDAIPPTVAMTSPANNAILSETVTISSSASDNVGVTLVELYSNGVLLYASNVAPYSYNWDTTKVANGNYSLFTIAKDNSGNSAQSSSVTVTVYNAASAPKAMVGTKVFSTLQASYDDTTTTNESVIKLLEGVLSDTLTAGRGISVKLEGGNNVGNAAISTETTIQGPVKIRAGTVRMKGINVR